MKAACAAGVKVGWCASATRLYYRALIVFILSLAIQSRRCDSFLSAAVVLTFLLFKRSLSGRPQFRNQATSPARVAGVRHVADFAAEKGPGSASALPHNLRFYFWITSYSIALRV